MISADFAPIRTALLSDDDVPLLAGRGVVRVKKEHPGRVELSLNMEEPGLVVLADRWSKGWRAFINGTETPVLRVNQVLRGVNAPTGMSTVVFQYAPQSWTMGLRIMLGALLALIIWISSVGWSTRRTRLFTRQNDAEISPP